MPSSPNGSAAVLDPATEQQMYHTLGQLSAVCGLPDPAHRTGRAVRILAEARTVEVYLDLKGMFDRWCDELAAERDPVLEPNALNPARLHRAVAEREGWTYVLTHEEPLRTGP